ncbi:MAG: AAA family ATPase [Dehalococcoidia bacterium]|nr:MAG: AAA family ATPase [Dehalococcoidia bacterium]
MSPLPELVQALLNPKAYPEIPQQIELVQTQMSFVFLTDSLVYKVKKPVNLGYLDYTTLEKRKFYCQREVELNRRLCPDAYLGVVPVTQHKNNIAIGGKGEAIEYAVRMRRLPQKKMMDALLGQDKVSAEMIAGVAERLAQFHRQAETSDAISQFGGLDTITQNTEENFTQTEKYIEQAISEKKYGQIKDYTDGFISRNASLFQKRVREGRIRDCHGDLHAAHICFSDGICIYDCIEFNDRFRYCDVASEVAFLAMDLDHYGRADLSRSFVKTYVAQSRDSELLRLLNFYKCYRAYVRGKVACFQLDDPYIKEKEPVRETARSYFDLAHAYLRPKPALFITVGLVGAGKTVLAQALARQLGLAAIHSDVTRKRLATIPLTEHRFEEFDHGIYSADFSRLTYDTMLNEARAILTEGGSVIIDASFIRAKHRREAKRLAEEVKADFFVIECTLAEEVVRQRLPERLKQGTVSDGRWEIFEEQKRQFEAVTEVLEANYAIIDTSQPVSETVRQVMAKFGVD